jgi:hypothetical protein
MQNENALVRGIELVMHPDYEVAWSKDKIEKVAQVIKNSCVIERQGYEEAKKYKFFGESCAVKTELFDNLTGLSKAFTSGELELQAITFSAQKLRGK